MRTRRVAGIEVLAFWIELEAIVQGAIPLEAHGERTGADMRAHQAQLLLAAGDPDAEAPPEWRRVSA
jgi:transposase